MGLATRTPPTLSLDVTRTRGVFAAFAMRSRAIHLPPAVHSWEQHERAPLAEGYVTFKGVRRRGNRHGDRTTPRRNARALRRADRGRLPRLEFIDAAGLEVLVRAAREHGGLTLQNASPMLVRLVKLTELEHVVHIDGSTPEGPASV
jgi:hypothetical protein